MKLKMNIQDEMKMLHQLQSTGKLQNPTIIKFDGDGMDIFIYSDNNFLISHSAFFQDDYKNKFDYCYLRMIYIPVEKRNKNFGKRIINDLIDKCKNYNIFRIEVESEVESLSFFSKLGFKQIENEVKNRLELVFNK